MYYLLSTEEIYITSMQGDIKEDKYGIEKINKLQNDQRVMEFQEGYYICKEKHKDELEQEYCATMIPLQPDDLLIE